MPWIDIVSTEPYQRQLSVVTDVMIVLISKCAACEIEISIIKIKKKEIPCRSLLHCIKLSIDAVTLKVLFHRSHIRHQDRGNIDNLLSLLSMSDNTLQIYLTRDTYIN